MIDTNGHVAVFAIHHQQSKDDLQVDVAGCQKQPPKKARLCLFVAFIALAFSLWLTSFASSRDIVASSRLPDLQQGKLAWVLDP